MFRSKSQTEPSPIHGKLNVFFFIFGNIIFIRWEKQKPKKCSNFLMWYVCTGGIYFFFKVDFTNFFLSLFSMMCMLYDIHWMLWKRKKIIFGLVFDAVVFVSTVLCFNNSIKLTHTCTYIIACHFCCSCVWDVDVDVDMCCCLKYDRCVCAVRALPLFAMASGNMFNFIVIHKSFSVP